MAADSFGIDTARVYKDDNDENVAFWTVMKGGTHGRIVNALLADAAVTTTITAKLAATTDTTALSQVVDVINRATAGCIGQAILGQKLNPADLSLTFLHLLSGGTAGDLDGIISAKANTKLQDAWTAKDTNKIVDVISRQTGRGLFQAAIAQIEKLATNPLNILSILKGDLTKVLPAEIADAIP